MPQMVNTALLKHPLNWFTVVFMLVLASIAGHLLLSYANIEPSTANK